MGTNKQRGHPYGGTKYQKIPRGEGASAGGPGRTASRDAPGRLQLGEWSFP